MREKTKKTLEEKGNEEQETKMSSNRELKKKSIEKGKEKKEKAKRKNREGKGKNWKPN